MRRTAIIGLLLLVSMVASACGEPEAGGDGYSGGSGAPAATPEDPDDTVSSTPDPGGKLTKGKGMPVSAQEGLVDIKPSPFETVKPNASGDAVDIIFYDGIEECYGVDHAHAEYESDEVVVYLFTGRNPEAEICTEQAVLKVFTLELTEPLDGRAIVDGAQSGD